jgi:hypothetical protein
MRPGHDVAPFATDSNGVSERAGVPRAAPSTVRVVHALLSGWHRMGPMASGYLWGIRAEVELKAGSLQVTEAEWSDCKSVAKASQVRILHLPPTREGRLTSPFPV